MKDMNINRMPETELLKTLIGKQIGSQLTIVKVGGKVIDDEAALRTFLQDFSAIEGQKILVHGGGKIASDIGQKMGIVPAYVEGRRITDKQTLDLVTMVYAGLINKQIVARLQGLGINALGLTGADANVLRAQLRPVRDIDYGYAGDLIESWTEVGKIAQFIATGLTPVFCPITHDGEGTLLNTNADTIASTLAAGMSKFFEVKLVYCFEQKGVLRDLEQKAVIPKIDSEIYNLLKADKVISDGMIPKMDNAFDALKAGVREVLIGHFSELKDLIAGAETGTKITLA